MRGFGMQIDLSTGVSRKWYVSGGIKRWADTDKIVVSDKKALEMRCTCEQCKEKNKQAIAVTTN